MDCEVKRKVQETSSNTMHMKILLVFTVLAFCIIAWHVDARSSWFLNTNAAAAQLAISHHQPWLIAVMKVWANIGNWKCYALIAIILCIVKKTRRSIGIPLAVHLGLTLVVNEILKGWFALPRPAYAVISQTGLSFPSGHAMYGIAFWLMGCWLLLPYIQEQRKKYLLLIATLFMAGVGFSRVYLCVHYLTDVLGGYAAGTALTLTVMLAVGRLRTYFRVADIAD